MLFEVAVDVFEALVRDVVVCDVDWTALGDEGLVDTCGYRVGVTAALVEVGAVCCCKRREIDADVVAVPKLLAR